MPEFSTRFGGDKQCYYEKKFDRVQILENVICSSKSTVEEAGDSVFRGEVPNRLRYYFDCMKASIVMIGMHFPSATYKRQL